MEYTPYIAAVAALIAGLFLYHRRKPRKPVIHGYCMIAARPSDDPVADSMRIYCVKRSD